MEHGIMKKTLHKMTAVPKRDDGVGGNILELIEAAYNGDVRKIRILLRDGANINSIEPETGFTCLHIACLNGDTEVVNALLEHHQEFQTLDFTIKSKDPPRSAWQLAMSARHYEIANLVDAAGFTSQPPPTSPSP